VRISRILNERWSVMSMPKFVNEASCASDTLPDDWFPEMEAVKHLPVWEKRFAFSYTPSALRARNICLSCPAFDECEEYSLQYRELHGIWANMDIYERAVEQRSRGIDPDTLPIAYMNELVIRSKEDNYLSVESEWADV
jgi:hypothetical protein